MKRAEVLQGLRQMKFEEILERAKRRRLSQAEAASILGMSERTFRRWRGRFEAEGAEGLYDRRASVKVHEYPDASLAIFHGPRCLARYDQKGELLLEPNQQEVA